MLKQTFEGFNMTKIYQFFKIKRADKKKSKKKKII